MQPAYCFTSLRALIKRQSTTFSQLDAGKTLPVDRQHLRQDHAAPGVGNANGELSHGKVLDIRQLTVGFFCSEQSFFIPFSLHIAVSDSSASPAWSAAASLVLSADAGSPMWCNTSTFL